MPAFLRMEIFPSDMKRTIDFYTNVLRFTLLRHEGDYAYLQRDGIFIGAAVNATHAEGSVAVVDSRYRRPPTGIEAVIEVDDIKAEREFIVGKGYPLDEDLRLQPWGLTDFRLIDPDGYYLRLTENSGNRVVLTS